MGSAAPERVVLLGFMGSGKTTVGRLLAARLEWRHLDLDTEIEREEGRSISEIFRDEGEAYFRRREVEATRRLLEATGTVLTPGGGWVTNTEVFDLLPDRTLTVWLHVSPEEVLRRLASDAERRRRPLLEGSDAATTVRRLLREREALYRRARCLIRTDGRDAEDIAQEIESIVPGRSGVPKPSC